MTLECTRIPPPLTPERYLEPRNEPDPASHAFGYGRRICSGRHLADASLFIFISRILATFDIQKAVDGLGNKFDPRVKTTPGLIIHPVDFPYQIKSRGAKSTNLIKSVEVEHPWEDGDAALL